MSHENPETAKIFLNLEDSPETTNAMSAEGEVFEQDQPQMPVRPQTINKPSSVASGPALVALIAILGGGSIFGMRVVSGHAAIDEQSFKLDYTPPAIGADFDTRFETTMLNLERSTRPVQVPIEYLAQRDPFEFATGDTQAITPVVFDDPNLPTAEELAERQRLRNLELAKATRRGENLDAMTKAIEGYELQSTLQGTNPVARISGEIVRMGGTLTYDIPRENGETDVSFFTIEDIGGRSAVMRNENGSRFELQIGMPMRELEPAEVEPSEDELAEAALIDQVAGEEFTTEAAQPQPEDANTEESGSTTGSEQAPVEEPVSGEAAEDGAESSDSASETVSEQPEPEMSFMDKLRAASVAAKEAKATEEAQVNEAAETVETEADDAAGTQAEEAGETEADEAAETDAGDAAETQAEEAGETEADEAAETDAGDAAETQADEAGETEADDGSEGKSEEAVEAEAEDTAEAVDDPHAVDPYAESEETEAGDSGETETDEATETDADGSAEPESDDGAESDEEAEAGSDEEPADEDSDDEGNG